MPVRVNPRAAEQVALNAGRNAGLPLTNMRNPGKLMQVLPATLGKSLSIMERVSPILLPFDLTGDAIVDMLKPGPKEA